MEKSQVIIIGGRPAGASLAIRLGQLGIKTLLLDKMKFPSLPSVPSSPIIYSQHIQQLDELGIDHADLFHADGRIDHFCVDFVGHFSAAVPLNIGDATYPYAYGADRTKFDTAIWNQASKLDTVTVRDGFSVTSIVKEDGKVVGIKGQSERGSEETFMADLVVGADGRFSPSAKHFGATVVEEHNDHITNSYHAEWEKVSDGPRPFSGAMYNTGKGFLVLMIPIDTRKYIVGTYMRPDRQPASEDLEQGYLDSLRSIPEVWARLENATRVTDVVGVRGIRNGIRTPSGDGWALVGDAFHYKDPLDGQGIYDALLEAKMLAEEIHLWQKGEKTWGQAGTDYGARAIAETRPMMLQTVSRVKREMFSDPPPFVIKTLIRWMMTSPEYQRDFVRLLTRSADPANWMTSGVMRRAIWRGLTNDLFRRSQPLIPAAGPVR